MWKYNRCFSQPSCSEEKYYYSRNNPHPRMVCHIPGLNNALVCVVRSSVSKEHPAAGNAGIRQQDQEHVLTGNTPGNASATCYLPKIKGSVRRELGTSQSVTQGHADAPKRIQNNPTSSEKLLKRQFQASAQSANREGIHIPPRTQPSSPFVNLHHGPCIQENMNSDSSQLDQEIKMLEKLSKILQTDSLTEIQKWFSKAGEKEKDLLSKMIYSEPANKGMLNAKEGTAENMNSLGLPNLFPPLQRGPEGDMNQSRKGERMPFALNAEKHVQHKQIPCSQGRTTTGEVLWKQETVLPSHSTRSLTCATATPKK